MHSNTQRNIWILSLLLAPTLIGIAQFFWNGPLITNTAGWLQSLAFVFWIPAFHGLFEQIRSQFPRYAAVGFLIAIYACVAGNNFGFEGLYLEAINATEEEYRTLHEQMGIGPIFTLYLPGILFPLSLLGVGIALIRAKVVPTWLGILLIIAAVGFPLSRMPRIAWLAHLDNGLLVLSHWLLAFRLFR